MQVIKHNGSMEEFNIKKIEEVYDRITSSFSGGDKVTYSFSHLEENIKMFLIDKISTVDINKIIIKSAINLISINTPKWDLIAGRFTCLNLYKACSKSTGIKVENLYSPGYFRDLVKIMVNNNLYHKNILESYSIDDLYKAGKYIDKDRDMIYNQTTMSMYIKRYLLNPNKNIRELPQHMYMAIGLFLAIPEDESNRLNFAFKVYDACSKGEISLPTPTLLNARQPNCQLSSCFEISLDDDLRGIYHGIENMAQISKFGGGIGVYLGNIRSKGGSIRGVHGTSSGTMPFAKVINDTAIAVNQLGVRAGAISVTLDVWHRDIFHFLDMQTETGDIRAKSFDLFPAVSFPDLFMERVEENGSWSLFDPKEILDVTGRQLQDYWGDEFVSFYMECEKNPNLILKERIEAKELFKTYLKSTVETGMPYAFFRDTVNKMNPNKHTGMIYHTNLCTEIQQNTSPSKFIEEKTVGEGMINIKYDSGDLVVCNLASINIAKVNTSNKIREIMPIITRLLDNVITLNFYPVEEAKITSNKYRPIGIGYLGLAEFLAVNKISYTSDEAKIVVEDLMVEFSQQALLASIELSKERGSYPLFQGSDWSKGILFGEDYNCPEKLRNDNTYTLTPFEQIVDLIKEHGLRFGYMFAPAPNTSTALVVGTTAALLPIYKKYYTETGGTGLNVTIAPNINENNVWYYTEYTNCDLGKVIDLISVVQKYIDQSISFEWQINPAKTTPKDLYGYYFKAWKQGIKTVYYVRSQSLDVQDNCISCSG